mgnify:CR=1 FL=1
MMTEFEKKVFRAVKKISRGQVATYKQIAKQAGRPKAARAVGSALKKNPKLIVVPCHRVIKSNGEIGGYVLGVKKKISLLKKEDVKIINGKIITNC